MLKFLGEKKSWKVFLSYPPFRAKCFFLFSFERSLSNFQSFRLLRSNSIPGVDLAFSVHLLKMWGNFSFNDLPFSWTWITLGSRILVKHWWSYSSCCFCDSELLHSGRVHTLRSKVVGLIPSGFWAFFSYHSFFCISIYSGVSSQASRWSSILVIFL